MGMVEEQKELSLISRENQEKVLDKAGERCKTSQRYQLSPLNDVEYIIVSHEAKRQDYLVIEEQFMLS